MLTRLRGPLIAAVLAAGLAVGLVAVLRGEPGKRITAYFSVAVGVYAGSDVRVLGVKVGTIDEVEPEGDRVRAVMTVDAAVSVPAEAKAVVIAPSVVSDRYIQLAPAYTEGPKMPSGAVIPIDRTATPVELDKLYESLQTITKALGPNGANKNGAVSRALEVGAENLSGNGTKLRIAILEASKAAKTLTGAQGDLFGTIKNLVGFTGMLRKNDGQVRTAEQQLAKVAGFLAADRETLGAALSQLATALVKVKTFIKDNRELIKLNVEKLAEITQTLVEQREAIAEALDVMPLTVGNVLNVYDPKTKSLRGRGNLNDLQVPLGGGR